MCKYLELNMENLCNNLNSIFSSISKNKLEIYQQYMENKNCVDQQSANDNKSYVKFYNEEDGSITLSLDEFGIAVNDDNKEKAMINLINDLKEYVQEYCEDMNYWNSDINRKNLFIKLLSILLKS